MKLTKRGKDFLTATLAGTITASIVDIKIVLALCLSLIIAALLSEIILARAFRNSIEITPTVSHVACFKGEESRTGLKICSPSRRLVSVTLSNVVLPEGIEANVDDSDTNMPNLLIKPLYAGRFSGLSAQFELKDTLGLFSKRVELEAEDFVIDCYPSSLLKEIRLARPLSIVLGEREGTTHGSGMEFYSLEEYTTGTDRKNILWKKVASMPDERLMVKVRETNIPKSLFISLIQTVQRGKHSIPWVDCACEGVGSLGKIILQIGCDVHLLFDSGGRVASIKAADTSELSEALMQMSTARFSDLDTASLLLTRADICVTGFIELQNELLASEVARKPVLLIGDEDASPSNVGDLAVIYTPEQDLAPLVNRVVGL